MGVRLVNLRNIIESNAFRLDIPWTLWKCHSLSEKTPKGSDVLILEEDGQLKGYAVLQVETMGEKTAVKVCRILELLAQDEGEFLELLDRAVELATKDGADFLYFRESEERFRSALNKRHAYSHQESAVMVTLLNAEELFATLSQKVERGRILELRIRDFDPVFLRIGKDAIGVVTKRKSDLVVSTDSQTFLKLLFAKSSLLKEFVKRKLEIKGFLKLRLAIHFFNLIKVEESYLPLGDWL